ncbi:MAG TPA: sigma 54-interacting transcriptional regulator [Acidobacteriota bacterium]|nr:sigma 54-interacting transcriptional regulator [Acidobacteriota bacterium]
MIQLVAICNERKVHFSLPDDGTEITAGSLPDNIVYLPYKGISRRHFSLTKNTKGWILQDLGSTNGTSLNGKLIDSAAVKPGDVIEAGAITIHVEPATDKIETIGFSDSRTADSFETDRMGQVDLRAEEIPFSFPKLKLPSEMILGKSQAIMEIYKKLHSIADSDLNILFVGETGTGKDFLSRMVHLSSKRASGPFVAVNCAALPAELFEAELFGIGEKVATNVNQRKGKIAAAEGGTLFLDELGSFPIGLQAKILRAIEDKNITRLGENKTLPVDFRMLSATNENPQELIRAGKLREDLYHRLSGAEIYVPPLRDRKEDLEILIPTFLHQISMKENKKLSGITKRLLSLLINYTYPGNLRELMNILKAMVALSHPGEVLDMHLVPEKLMPSGHERDNFIEELLDAENLDLKTSVDEFTRQLILRALKRNDGNIPKAAAQLKITTFGLRKAMKRLQISMNE